jgi:hypothetical protein
LVDLKTPSTIGFLLSILIKIIAAQKCLKTLICFFKIRVNCPETLRLKISEAQSLRTKIGAWGSINPAKAETYLAE